MQKLALHWQIILGMIFGVLIGLIAVNYDFGPMVVKWLKPLGTIFINMLKLIAIPLILASLIKGVSDLQDISKFSKMGLRTLLMFITTTVIAVSIGLLVVNAIKPGKMVSSAAIEQLTSTYTDKAVTKLESANFEHTKGPLQFLVDMVPDNIFMAASQNGNMLQVIFFAIFFGIALLLVDPYTAKPVKDFFTGINEVIMKMVDLIMLTAPIAVMALIATLIVETQNTTLFKALLWYMVCVIIGLGIMMIFYLLLVYLFTKRSPVSFLKAISPAQLLAFSTSSSAATLPVTMERVEEHIGVDKEVSSFVCPVGATVNMDGTSLYQAVAAVFICQALQYDLTLNDQLTIVLTATLASIGSAAVPGAGMVMLVVVLESVNFPREQLALGLALIFAVDRPLDMMRTVINVSGDATVATIIAKTMGKLRSV